MHPLRKLSLTFTATCATCLTAPVPALMVHEWGTFTTVSSSSGRPLSGLYVDASRLPAFVHGIPYFNYDPVAGWASPDKLRNVTVKMETPVIYFYAEEKTEVEAKVEFRGGTISQWYPQCYLCESEPAAPFVDFAKEPYPGHIGWKATVLPPDTNIAFTTTASGLETPEWTAPRLAESNLVRGSNGEVEKFLFYRGLGNFASPVSLRFLADGTLSVSNRGKEDIAYLMLYDRPRGAAMLPATIWFQGALRAGQEVRTPYKKLPPDYGSYQAMDIFRLQLEKAGLTNQEARGLLDTWYNGYFIEGGLKAFWIVPRAQVDTVLRLEIKPQPDILVRVIVGRSEILDPEFENELYHAQAVDSLAAKFSADKYYLVYRDFLSQGKDWHVEPTPATALAARDGKGEIGKGETGKPAGSRRGVWTAPIPGAAVSPRAADLLGRRVPVGSRVPAASPLRP